MRFARFDRHGRPLGDLEGVISAERTRRVDGTDMLEISLTGEVGKDDRIVAKDSMGRWCEWIARSPASRRSTSIPVGTVVCQGSWCELESRTLVEVRNRGLTASQCLAKALAGTRWSVGRVDATQTKNTSFYHISAMEAVEKICDEYGLEMEASYEVDGSSIASRSINLVARRGRESVAHRFEYGRDLVDVSRTYSEDHVVTRLYAYGKATEDVGEDGSTVYGRKLTMEDALGVEYVEDASLLAVYGIPGADGALLPLEAVEDFPECDDVNELVSLARARLGELSRPRVTYKGTVAALSRAGEGFEGADIGDTVHAVDTSITPELRLEARVLEIEEDMAGSVADAELTIGNIVEPRTARDRRMEAAVQSLASSRGAWDGAAAISGSYMDRVIERLNEVLNDLGGYTYITENDGIYCYSAPRDEAEADPDAGCIHVGGGYLQIANAKKPDGSWDWKTAATGAGFVADVVLAGILSAVRIESAVDPDHNYWDLATGAARMLQLIAGKVGVSDTNFAEIGQTTAFVVTAADGSISRVSGRGILYYEGADLKFEIVTDSGSNLYMQALRDDGTLVGQLVFHAGGGASLTYRTANGLMETLDIWGGSGATVGYWDGSAYKSTSLPPGYTLVPVYRLENEHTSPHMHLWTADYTEYTNLKGLNWTDRGVAFYAFVPQAAQSSITG